MTGPCDYSGKKGSIVSSELLFCCKYGRIEMSFGSRQMTAEYTELPVFKAGVFL